MNAEAMNNQEGTIIVNKYVKSTRNSPMDYHYRGLKVHALYGLHEHIATLATKFFEKGSNLLDLGAGSGAMSLRLADLGFRVTAVDILEESFALRGIIPFKRLDLNTSFSKEFNIKFDGILAIEIIEHLENPRKFLRECVKLLNPNGNIIITTPNIDNPVSKALFVRQGSFMWFNDFNYKWEGHISPMSQWEIQKIVEENKLEVRAIHSFGDPYKDVKKRWIKLYFLAKLIEKIENYKKSSDLMGEILVLILRLTLS